MVANSTMWALEMQIEISNVEICRMNILDKIVAQKKIEVAKLPQRTVSAQDLQTAAMAGAGGALDFLKRQHCGDRSGAAWV